MKKKQKNIVKSQNEPRVNKTEEQIALEMKQKQEVRRQRAIARDRLFPLLLKCSKNIQDAIQFMAVLALAIRQQFNKQMQEQKIKDIKLQESIDPKADRSDYYREFLDILNDETIISALGQIEGLGNEVERLIKKETSERSLETLKTDFIEE